MPAPLMTRAAKKKGIPVFSISTGDKTDAIPRTVLPIILKKRIISLLHSDKSLEIYLVKLT